MEPELPRREWIANDEDFEGQKRPRWREKKLPKSNSREEMNHLLKSNQPI